MSDLAARKPGVAVPRRTIRLGDRLARRAFVSVLRSLRRGRIDLVEGTQRRTFGTATEEHPYRAIVEVHDPRFYRDAVLGGSIGVGESYMDGRFSSDDLATLVRIVAANPELLGRMDGGLARLRAAFERVMHLRRRNTPQGSRSNIEAHYDLGNDFFSLFLDETLMYSCALFSRREESLADASRNKLDRICRTLGLKSGSRVVEIGSGWGGFALHAAARYGCEVVTTTISPKQHEHTLQAVRSAGLEDRVRVLREDYRNLPSRLESRFDALVSIEMIEAVGHEFLPDYFRTCADLLRPEGAALIQAIVIDDADHDRYRRSVDFIQRYIFPGGCLPSLAAIGAAVARGTDLTLRRVDDITEHYPPTLRAWRRRLLHEADRVRELGFSHRFVRMWEFYFAYCEGGFLERTIGDLQLLLAKPRWSGASATEGPVEARWPRS